MIARLSLVFTLAAPQVIASDSCGGTFSISSQSDADAISNCEEIEGSLAISQDASGTITLDNLREAKGGFTVDGASGLKKISASNLERVGRGFAVENNGELSQLSMSNLQRIDGSMTVEGNDNLRQLELDNLEKVEGDMTLKGVFDRISLSNLDDVKGHGSIQSSGSMSCSDLNQLSSNGVFGGTYSCSTATTPTSPSSSSSSTTSSTTSSSTTSSSTMSSSTSSTSSSTLSSSPEDPGLSDGGKAGVAVGVIVGVALIAGAIWFILRRRKKGAASRTVPVTDVGNIEKGGKLKRNSAFLTSPPPVAAGNTSPRPTAVLPQQDLELDIPMLDSGDVHEAPTVPFEESRDTTQYFELDSGPIRGAHQQAIHHE